MEPTLPNNICRTCRTDRYTKTPPGHPARALTSDKEFLINHWHVTPLLQKPKSPWGSTASPEHRANGSSLTHFATPCPSFQHPRDRASAGETSRSPVCCSLGELKCRYWYSGSFSSGKSPSLVLTAPFSALLAHWQHILLYRHTKALPVSRCSPKLLGFSPS